MRFYPDANVILALLTFDSLTARAEAIWPADAAAVVVSDFARAECAAAVAKRYRTRQASRKATETVLERLDAATNPYPRIGLISADVSDAEALIRRLDHPLRAPDALHIVMARRIGAALATFDRQMAGAARALGLEVID